MLMLRLRAVTYGEMDLVLFAIDEWLRRRPAGGRRRCGTPD